MEVNSAIAEVMRSRTRDEWINILRQAGVSAAPVLEVNELASEPQFTHRQMIMQLDHPTQGKVKQVGIPIKFSKTPAKFRSFAPTLGENTREIMLSLGYNVEQFDRMKASGIIK